MVHSRKSQSRVTAGTETPSASRTVRPASDQPGRRRPVPLGQGGRAPVGSRRSLPALVRQPASRSPRIAVHDLRFPSDRAASTSGTVGASSGTGSAGPASRDARGAADPPTSRRTSTGRRSSPSHVRVERVARAPGATRSSRDPLRPQPRLGRGVDAPPGRARRPGSCFALLDRPRASRRRHRLSLGYAALRHAGRPPCRPAHCLG